MLRGVRARITALSALIVVVVLSVTAVALVGSQRRSLTDHVDETLRRTALDLARAHEAGDLPSPLVPPGNEESLAQVATADGRVVAATPNASASDLLVPLPAGADEARRTVRLPSGEDRMRVLARRAGDAIVIAGISYDDVDESVATLRRALLVAIPLVAAVLALLTWWLVGRTLRPVEEIRAEVAGITDANLDRRVPVPETGDEIARLAETMNAMLERLDRAAERQRRFVADASHELRSPLARMRSELEVDARHPETADFAATHRSLLEEAIGLHRLVDDLLQLARADASEAPTHPVLVDLDDIVLREAERLRADGSVTVDLSALSAAQVTGDREQLARAVRNVAENAARHAHSVVSISVREVDDRAEIVVADDGPGIPPDQRAVVFERFTRLDGARAGADGGTGLGLPIAMDIVRRHGGVITIDASYRSGAAFVLSFPRADA